MVQKLSEQIRECYHHAEDCFWQAKDQGDPKIRNDFLDCERELCAEVGDGMKG
jgi:hypothetical protein